MNRISRRALAEYAASQLLSGKPAVQVAKYLAAVMAESGRADQVDFLIGDIAWQLERRQALTIAQVTTAHELTQDLAEVLKEQIKKTTQSDEVVLEEHIDKSVIGGVRIETAGRVWDDTVARKLTDLREAF